MKTLLGLLLASASPLCNNRAARHYSSGEPLPHVIAGHSITVEATSGHCPLQIHPSPDPDRKATSRKAYLSRSYTTHDRAYHQAQLARCSCYLFSGSRALHAVSRIFGRAADRKSTRLNSSHVAISYAVFCLKKKIN